MSSDDEDDDEMMFDEQDLGNSGTEEKGQTDHISNIKDVFEQIVGMFIKRFLTLDSIEIMTSWCTYKLQPKSTAIEDVSVLLDIFCFKPFNFSIGSNYVELFENQKTLKIANESLTKESQHYLKRMKKLNDQTSDLNLKFFTTKTVVAFKHTIYSNFRFNYLFETLLDRKMVIYLFLWSVFQFDIFKMKPTVELLEDRNPIGGFMWLAIEQFMLKNVDKFSHQGVKELKYIQSFVQDVPKLYDFLSNKFLLKK